MAGWNGGCTLSMESVAPTVTDASHVISPHSDGHRGGIFFHILVSLVVSLIIVNSVS